jgi:hypothetical protein
MLEAGVVIDFKNQPIFWHLPEGRSAGGLPDSRELWDVIWENRAQVEGFAHSHPGSGIPSPSYTDLTTFAAMEAGLGKRLSWYITSSDRLVVLLWVGPGPLDYHRDVLNHDEAAWVGELRRLSNVKEAT